MSFLKRIVPPRAQSNPKPSTHRRHDQGTELVSCATDSFSTTRNAKATSMDEGHTTDPEINHLGFDNIQPSSSLASLPFDVLIEILCWDLAPGDLVAISHTCRALRACMNSDIVWHYALLQSQYHGRITLPIIHAPILELDQADTSRSRFTITTAEIRARPLPVSSSPSRVTWLESTQETLYQRTHLSARKLYQRTMRIRDVLTKHAEPTVEPFATISITPSNIPPGAANTAHTSVTSPGMTLSTRGEVLALWFMSGEMHLIDLRAGDSYRQECIFRFDTAAPFRSFNSPLSFDECLSVEPFLYRNQEGYVIVFEMESHLNVLFQPIRRSGDEQQPEPVMVCALRLNSANLYKIKVSGRWLIFFELHPADDWLSEVQTIWLCATIVDLESGERWTIPWLLHGDKAKINIEVIDNQYVVLDVNQLPQHFRLFPGGTTSKVELDSIRDPTKIKGSLWTPIGAPCSLSFEPYTKRHYFASWHEDENGIRRTELHLSVVPPPPEDTPFSNHKNVDMRPKTRSPPLYAKQVLHIGSSIVAPVGTSVFGDPSSWDSVTRAWYNRGHKRGIRRITNEVSLSLKNSARGTSSEPFCVHSGPQLLASHSFSGDAYHCLSLAYPFTVTRWGDLREHPLLDRTNVVLTQVIKSKDGGQKKLAHRLLLVRGRLELGYPGRKHTSQVKPLHVHADCVLRWSAVAGILVVLETSSESHRATLYRVVIDPV
ncbi:hypothetical protein DL93DRAFT_2230137 [Clavulina sp. PMI_390]|nr:hypothetical protein DL93DRAFT_2230137 [Clavulina sp. PMI_390]